MNACFKCNSNMEFMDNSFTGLYMWCTPYFYCRECDVIYYYDDGIKEDINITKKHKEYLIKCFNVYAPVKDRVWEEYRNFISKYKFGVYSIPKNDYLKWINDFFGFDYVGMQPNGFI